MKKMLLLLFISAFLIFGNTSSVLAAQEMDLEEENLIFFIGDDDALLWIPALTNVSYNLFVEYTVSNTSLSRIDETSHFARAEKFNLPELFGIEVHAAFGGIKYTPTGYGTLTNSTEYQSNVLVDPNWIWDCQVDEEGILLPNYTSVTVKATASFYCEDAGNMVAKTNSLVVYGVE